MLDSILSYQYIAVAIIVVIVMATIFFYLLPAFLTDRNAARLASECRECRSESGDESAPVVDILTSKGCFRIRRAHLGAFLNRLKRIIMKYKDHLGVIGDAGRDERQKNEAATIEELEREIHVASIINHLKHALADFDCQDYTELDKATAVAGATPQKVEMDHYDSSCVDLSVGRVVRMLIEMSAAIEKLISCMIEGNMARYYVDLRHLDSAISELEFISHMR